MQHRDKAQKIRISARMTYGFRPCGRSSKTAKCKPPCRVSGFLLSWVPHLTLKEWRKQDRDTHASEPHGLETAHNRDRQVSGTEDNPCEISPSMYSSSSAFCRAPAAQSAGPAQEIPANLVLERFAVAKNGELLLVPVTVAAKDYLFVVDTGATWTVFDTSIPLGQAVEVATMQAAEGKVEVKVYQPPEARVGRTSLGPLETVGGTDLDSIRKVSGHPVHGFLGMDFLGRYVVHIDIEKGEVLLLKSAPKSAGVELPMSWDPSGRPLIAAELAPGERIRFMVDTGSQGSNSGSLGILEIQSLVRKGQFREIGKVLQESISGTSSHALFQGADLSIGGLAVRSPIFRESHGSMPNVLGLGFWSVSRRHSTSRSARSTFASPLISTDPTAMIQPGSICGRHAIRSRCIH